jgi:hypothetical protein
LTNFDLTFNPLGEAGARAIFRNILRGSISCWVFMVRVYFFCFATLGSFAGQLSSWSRQQIV